MVESSLAAIQCTGGCQPARSMQLSEKTNPTKPKITLMVQGNLGLAMRVILDWVGERTESRLGPGF